MFFLPKPRRNNVVLHDSVDLWLDSLTLWLDSLTCDWILWLCDLSGVLKMGSINWFCWQEQRVLHILPLPVKRLQLSCWLLVCTKVLTLRNLHLRRVSSAKKKRKDFFFYYCSLEALDTNVLMVLASMTSWSRSFQSLMGLGRNEYTAGTVSAVWLWELLVVSLSLMPGWWLELVLNSTSGNDVVVDSVQHCQPSCLSSVGGNSC